MKPLDTSPDKLDARYQEALALHRQGQVAAAQGLYRAILASEPRHFDALHMLGVAAGQTGQPEAAIELLTGALALKPDHAATWTDRGIALHSAGHLDEAVASFDRALAIEPAAMETLYCRAVTLQALKRHEEALASFERVLAQQPRRVEAHYGSGLALVALLKLPEAVAAFDRALALRPGYVDALNDRGHALRRMGRLDDALASFGQALAIQPGMPGLFGTWLHTRMMVCDWNALAADYARLEAGVNAGKRISPPFVLTATPLSSGARRRCAEIHVRSLYPGLPILPASRSARERIRVGYFSADFRRHAVAYLVAGMFEAHDRRRFELVGFAFGPPARGPVRARIAAAFDRFIDVEAQSDAEVAELARTLEIDIAVDLMGHTFQSRTGIFARRAAPLQVNYLGYPGTMGGDFMDYLIADRTVIRLSEFGDYSEKIVHLPHCYQANDAHRAIAGGEFTRREAGLPDEGFVFCCFNNNWKITPEFFDIWMRLLHRVEGSVLWLLEDNASASRNLRVEAERRGVAPARVIFAPRMNLPEHLARHRLADLFLDTLPYNAHTTASDALWTGLPVLTCPGETFAGRVAASLLGAVGLPELITTSIQDYEALALALATDPNRLAALRQRLAANRLTRPLFDTAQFTRHIEAAYALMWRRHQAGLPPDHIVVPDEVPAGAS